ncbi:MAG: thioredoxin family protein [Rikenellaceae bacterium]
MIKKLTTTLALLLAVGTLSAQVDFHAGSTTELYKRAKSAEKLIFMDLYATWCPPCKMMERDVFSREDVGNFMNENFINAKYNIDEEVGKQFANQYEVRSIPTYLIFDESGKLVGRMMGGMKPEEFISNMKKILEQAK